MAAWLRLPRSDGYRYDLPDDPRLCETCRERRARASGYCSRLCRLFDLALGELVAARLAADGDPTAAPVVIARTRLRAVAAVHDLRRLAGGDGPDRDRRTRIDAADWQADIEAGLLLPVPYPTATAAVRQEIDASG